VVSPGSVPCAEWRRIGRDPEPDAGRRHAIERELTSSVSAVAPVNKTPAQIVYGDQNWLRRCRHGQLHTSRSADRPLAEGTLRARGGRLGREGLHPGRDRVKKLFTRCPCSASKSALSTCPARCGSSPARARLRTDEDDTVLMPWSTVVRRPSGRSPTPWKADDLGAVLAARRDAERRSRLWLRQPSPPFRPGRAGLPDQEPRGDAGRAEKKCGHARHATRGRRRISLIVAHRIANVMLVWSPSVRARSASGWRSAAAAATSSSSSSPRRGARKRGRRHRPRARDWRSPMDGGKERLANPPLPGVMLGRCSRGLPA